MRVLLFLVYLLFIPYSFSKEEKILDFMRFDCPDLGDPDYGKDQLIGCRRNSKSEGEIYANYTSKQQKNKLYKYTVDKIFFKPKSTDGKYLFCDTSVNGLGNVFNRVQCHVVNQEYCEQLYHLKSSIKKCIDDSLAKFDHLDNTRKELEAWYKTNSNKSGKDSGHKLIDYMYKNLGTGVNLDFSKGILHIKNQHGRLAVKGDLESAKPVRFKSRLLDVQADLVQNFAPESELCEQAIGPFDSWRPSTYTEEKSSAVKRK